MTEKLARHLARWHAKLKNCYGTLARKHAFIMNFKGLFIWDKAKRYDPPFAWIGVLCIHKGLDSLFTLNR